MTTTVIKSAVRECRDQLFLDRAVDKYLSHVTANLSLVRPILGFHDDSVWRAVVRRLALDYRQVINLFYDLLTIIFGPKSTVFAALAEDTVVTDNQLWLTDWMNVPQRGTLVLDENLPTEETVEYTFRDPRNGLVTLASELLFAHTAIDTDVTSWPVNYTTANYAPAVVSLVLEDTTFLPVPAGGAKYTLIIDAGTDVEEVVILNTNNTATNTLTIDAPGLVNSHLGPKTTPAVTDLVSILGSRSVIKVGSSRNFPAEGLIRVQQNVLAGVPTKTVRYVYNDTENGFLTLAAALPAGFLLPAAGIVTVTLMEPGAAVAVAQAQVKGVDWDIFQTSPNLIQIYLPVALCRNRLQDASFLHSNVIAGPPTLATTYGATAGDTIIRCIETDVNLRTFPRSGIIKINPGGGTEEYCGYTIPDYDMTVIYASDVTGVAINSTIIYVNDARLIQDGEAINPEKWIALSMNSVARFEFLQYTSIDLAKNKITLATPTTKLHLGGDTANGPNGAATLYLSRPLTNNHVAAEDVVLFQVAWAGTDLEDGRIAHGNKLFSGHYAYDPRTYYARVIQTTLNENVAGPTTLVSTQSIGRNGLEVKDAALFDATGTFDVKLRYGGDEETLDVTTVVTKPAFATIGVHTDAPASIGDYAMTVAHMPLWGGDDIGIRLIIDQGGANEEVIVLKKVLLATSITLEEPLIKNHLAAESIKTLSDVILLSEALAVSHNGAIKWTQRTMVCPGPLNKPAVISRVEEIRTRIDVVSAATLPPAGDAVLLNFGSIKTVVDSRLVADYAAAVGALTLVDSSLFPVAGYPYIVEIGVDCEVFEKLTVTANVANVLTLGSNTLYKHKKGEWVQYRPGVLERATYTSTVTGGPERLLFSDGVTFADSHLKGEVVSLDNRVSLPSKYGTDFPLYVSSSWEDRLRYLFDLGRAAGVQIVIIDDK